MLVRTSGLSTAVRALVADGRDPTEALRARGHYPDEWHRAGHCVAWPEWVAGCEALVEIIGGPQEYRALRARASTARHSADVGRILHLAGDLITAYRIVYEWYAMSAYPIHDAELTLVSDTEFDLAIRLNPREVGSTSMFYGIWGALEVLPELSGRPPAQVSAAIIDDHSADFRVRLPELSADDFDPDDGDRALDAGDRGLVIASLLDHARQLRTANIGLMASLDEAERREVALLEANRRRANAERDLAAQERAALESSHLTTLGQLASGIAHDFSNLLTVVVGNVNLIMTDDLSQRSARAAEAILDASQLAGAMTQRLLSVAQSETVTIEEFDLDTVLGERLDLLQRLLRSVEIRLHVEPDIPPVLGDPTRLLQALANLALNAEEAGAARLDMVAGRQGELAVIAITDTGPGMAPDVVAVAFDPFFSTKDNGTGLGLPSSREAIESMGGTISLTSELGVGTRFRVELPLAASNRSGTAIDSYPS